MEDKKQVFGQQDVQQKSVGEFQQRSDNSRQCKYWLAVDNENKIGRNDAMQMVTIKVRAK